MSRERARVRGFGVVKVGFARRILDTNQAQAQNRHSSTAGERRKDGENQEQARIGMRAGGGQWSSGRFRGLQRTSSRDETRGGGVDNC